MAEITVYTKRAGELHIARLPSRDALDLVDDLENGDSVWLTLVMDETIVKVRRSEVIRVDLEPPAEGVDDD